MKGWLAMVCPHFSGVTISMPLWTQNHKCNLTHYVSNIANMQVFQALPFLLLFFVVETLIQLALLLSEGISYTCYIVILCLKVCECVL